MLYTAFKLIWIKKMSILKRILPVALIITMISSCAWFKPAEEEADNYRTPRFTNLDPIELKVKQIDIVSEFTPTFTRPNVEHLFPISIEKTAKTWAHDRLKAVDFGSDRIATVIIKDASVTEEVEKAQEMFTKDRIKYRANLDVIIRVSDTQSLAKAETEVIAWRELIIPADTDITEKEQYWNSMVNKLFNEFNAKMDQNIHRYLNAYIANNTHIENFE